jgi:hypothetical protein
LIEYDPVTRVERGLLVEPGATNLWLRSEPADATGYTAASVVFQNASTVMTPLGTRNVVRLEDSTVGRAITQVITVTNGLVYTISGFVRLDSGGIPNNIGGTYRDFTLTINAADVNLLPTAFVNLGNGVYRFSHTFTSNGSGSFVFRKYISLNSNEPVTVTGLQLETGSVATSYMPTVASTFNRVADVVSLTGASSLIGQTSGTIYCEINARNFNSSPTFRRILALTDGTAANGIQLFFGETSSTITAGVVANTNVGATIASSAQTGTVKMAVAYANNDVAFYINGVQIGTDTSVTIPACSKVNIGSRGSDDTNQINDHIRSAVLFPTRKNNAELAAMTT